MRNKYGKFYARWTAADGKRHEKACDSKSAAARYQLARKKEAQAKKARARATSARLRKRGPRAARTSTK